jgi:hypothetical protein
MRLDAKRVKFYFEALNESASVADYRVNVLRPGQWHLPFITHTDRSAYDLETLKRISAARCARTSYLLPENGMKSDVKRDLELFERLAVRNGDSTDPRHLSPLEHQAEAIKDGIYVGNFRGWKQFRKEISSEAGPSVLAQNDQIEQAFH